MIPRAAAGFGQELFLEQFVRIVRGYPARLRAGIISVRAREYSGKNRARMVKRAEYTESFDPGRALIAAPARC